MIKTNEWVCGNVAVKASLNLPDETPEGVATLAVEGLTQILQRKPSSAWEKAEAGYEKRPDGFKRSSIAYGADSAARLVEAFESAIPAGVEVEFEVSEHTGGETVSPRKMATAMWAQIKGTPMAATIKADENTTDEQGIELAHKFLAGLKTPKA